MAAPNPMELEQKVLGRRIFGENIPANKYRNFYESSTPTTQCNNIIKPFENNIPCYICGLPIFKQGEDGDGLGPECEHILPIAQAILFLGVYGAKYKPDQIFYNPEILHFEYAWAHRTCNQVKSDKVYTTYNPINEPSKRFGVNNDGLKQLLRDIWNNDRSDSIIFNTELKRSYKSVDDFINSRFSPVTNKNGKPIDFFPPKKGLPTPPITVPFQEIVNYLNSFDSSEMLLLIAAAKAIEGPMSREAIEFVKNINHNELVKKKISSLKKQLDDFYDKILGEAITQYSKDWPNPELIETFKQKALSYKPFYTSLYIKLPEMLRPNWSDYIGVKLMTIFYDTLVYEPMVVNTLLKIANGTLPSSENNENNQKIAKLAQQITQYVARDFYKAITLEEESILHNTGNNFASTAATLSPLGLMGINRPPQGKLGFAAKVKIPKAPKPIYKRPPKPPKPEKPIRKSAKAKTLNNMREKGIQRRSERAIAIRKNAKNRETAKRRKTIIKNLSGLTGLSANTAIQTYQGTNTNMKGGYINKKRYTLKNKK